jgi:segregation and condensation protein B
MEPPELQRAIEALLFASEKPLTLDHIQMACEEGVTAEHIRTALRALREEYDAAGRGFKLYEIAGGYQFMTDPKHAPFLRRFYQAREKKRLSQASLETLSVVAYKQPASRADIEFIRGVNVDGALKTLLEKGLVRIVGRKDVPGRPMLYGTTREFLEHFGLKSTDELPPLSEFSLKDIEDRLLPPELKGQTETVKEGES